METFIKEFGPFVATVMFIVILIILIKRLRRKNTSYSFKNKSKSSTRYIKDKSGNSGTRGDQFK